MSSAKRPQSVWPDDDVEVVASSYALFGLIPNLGPGPATLPLPPLGFPLQVTFQVVHQDSGSPIGYSTGNALLLNVE